MSRLRLASIGIASVSLLSVTYPAFGEKADDHIYCTRTGGERHATWDTYYYTAVFPGDYSLWCANSNSSRHWQLK